MAMSSRTPGGRKRGARAAHRPDASINVTPFVDVLLILLVVFMVVSTALPGLSRTSNVVVVVRGANQGEVYMTEPDSLRIAPGALFTGGRNDVTAFLFDTFSPTDNFSYRGENVVPFTEVEAWARDIIDNGYSNVKLRFRRTPVPEAALSGQTGT